MRMGRRRYEDMVDAATVDCYNDSELITGWYTMIEDNLAVPFETAVLGVTVRAEKVELTAAGQIMVRCRRGRHLQPVSILELPMPTPPPDGSEWIDAYRRWVRSGALG